MGKRSGHATLRSASIAQVHAAILLSGEEVVVKVRKPGVDAALRSHLSSGKVFASQERVSGFPEKGRTSGEVRETSGEVRGTSGEVWETSGEPLDCC